MPRQLWNLEPIHAGPDAGGVGNGAQIGLRGLCGSRGIQAGLGLDFCAEPTSHPDRPLAVNCPIPVEVEVVRAEVGVSLSDTRHAGAGKGLLEGIAQTVIGQPVLRPLHEGVESTDRQERCGLDRRVAEFVQPHQVRRQGRRNRREETQIIQVRVGLVGTIQHSLGYRRTLLELGNLADQPRGSRRMQPGGDFVGGHADVPAETVG